MCKELWRVKDFGLYIIVLTLASTDTVEKLSTFVDEDQSEVFILCGSLYFLLDRLFGVDRKIISFRSSITFIWYLMI